MTDSERDRLDDLKARLRDAQREGETHKELENLVSDAADALDARDAEIARLRKALTQIDALDPGENIRFMAGAALASNTTNMGHIARTALNGGDDEG
jgi:hypothetical protein